MPDAGRKHMTVEEFAREGYLQGVNRVFFHPLGLALSWSSPGMTYEEFEQKMADAGYQYGHDAMSNAWAGACLMGADKPRFGPIFDDRDDQEGIIFDWNTVNDEMRDKMQNVSREWESRKPARIAGLGYLIQPLDAQVVTAEGIEKLIEESGGGTISGGDSL